VTGRRRPDHHPYTRATGDELLALVHVGLPFYKPPWSTTIVGMVIDDDTDWAEPADRVTESYGVCAPRKLTRLLAEATRQAHPQTCSPLDAGGELGGWGHSRLWACSSKSPALGSTRRVDVVASQHTIGRVPPVPA
jgi:hypothetical protein